MHEALRQRGLLGRICYRNFEHGERAVALDETKEEGDRIIAMGDNHEMGVVINIGFEQRFMAKMALGLGSTVLGSPFLNTSYAASLRKLMWERDQTERAKIGVFGSGFLKAETDSTAEFVGWRGAYTIRLHAPSAAGRLVLSLHFPSSRVMHIVVSDDPSLWSSPDLADLRDGRLYLVLPQLGEVLGPLPMPHYVSHRLGNIQLPQLQALEQKRIDPSTLPACR